MKAFAVPVLALVELRGAVAVVIVRCLETEVLARSFLAHCAVTRRLTFFAVGKPVRHPSWAIVEMMAAEKVVARLLPMAEVHQ